MSALHCRPSPYSVFFDMKQRADPHFVMMSRFLAVLHGTGQLTSSGKVFVCGLSVVIRFWLLNLGICLYLYLRSIAYNDLIFNFC